jgi:hypothetical protein
MTGTDDEALVDEPHCEECSRLVPRDARGWHEEMSADGTRVLSCPACWEREFGDGGPRAPERAEPL